MSEFKITVKYLPTCKKVIVENRGNAPISLEIAGEAEGDPPAVYSWGDPADRGRKGNPQPVLTLKYEVWKALLERHTAHLMSLIDEGKLTLSKGL